MSGPSRRITPGQALRVGAEIATWLLKSDLEQELVQKLLQDRRQMTTLGEGTVQLVSLAVRGELVEKVMIKVFSDPEKLAVTLASQTSLLLARGAHKALKISEGKYEYQVMTAVKTFKWRPELAGIGLDQVALVDYRLSGKFLAEAGGVKCYIDPDKCKNYKGVETPSDRPMVIQGQWGSKYRGRSPHWCLENFHELEQELVVKEALTLFLYQGKPLLDVCFIDIAGSVSEHGSVPCLRWDGGPRLSGDRAGAIATPLCGSASRGK